MSSGCQGPGENCGEREYLIDENRFVILLSCCFKKSNLDSPTGNLAIPTVSKRASGVEFPVVDCP